MDVSEGEERAQVELALQSILMTALKRLEKVSSEAFARSVQVGWNSRMRSTAGRAFWPEARVELNPKLIQISLKEVERTLLHELAHLLAYHRCGRRRIAPHGIEWQQACIDLGIPGESATHRLPLPQSKQTKKWRYSCPQCAESFERVRAMKSQAACYTCCKKYNSGRFAQKFLLRVEKISLHA